MGGDFLTLKGFRVSPMFDVLPTGNRVILNKGPNFAELDLLVFYAAI